MDPRDSGRPDHAMTIPSPEVETSSVSARLTCRCFGACRVRLRSLRVEGHACFGDRTGAPMKQHIVPVDCRSSSPQTNFKIGTSRLGNASTYSIRSAESSEEPAALKALLPKSLHKPPKKLPYESGLRKHCHSALESEYSWKILAN